MSTQMWNAQEFVYRLEVISAALPIENPPFLFYAVDFDLTDLLVIPRKRRWMLEFCRLASVIKVYEMIRHHRKPEPWIPTEQTTL